MREAKCFGYIVKPTVMGKRIHKQNLYEFLRGMFYALKVLPVDNSIKTTANEKIHTLKHFRIQEKKEEIRLSPMKKNFHPQKNKKKAT